MTLGEKRVNWNIDDTAEILKTKTYCADLIDFLEQQKGEYKTKSEKSRCLSKAQTDIETACMYAVKSFYKD